MAIQEVREMLLEVLNKPYDDNDIVKEIGIGERGDVDLARDPRHQTLCLINCLYEALYLLL